MKFLRIAAAAVFAFAFGNAYAFHSGGVAECEGCHTMHNSFDGAANAGFTDELGVFHAAAGLSVGAAGPYLLKANDQSGACLNCHDNAGPGSYHIATPSASLVVGQPPRQYTPGGDFAWLKKTYTFSIRNSPATDDGDHHGHNINAADFGYTSDKTLAVAPGGTYPADKLACSSCHDPHGKFRRDWVSGGTYTTTGSPIVASGSYGSTTKANNSPVVGKFAVGAYRILGGVGYQPKSLTGSFAFANTVPDATAPSTYNFSETNPSVKQINVVYGQGMSEWCSNCHGKMHMDTYTSGTSKLVHPAGNGAKITNAAIVTNYQTYVTSGVMTGSAATAYSSLAPFEIGSNDYSGAAAGTLGKAGNTLISASSNVSCLSCHRAHASGFESMVRYGLNNEFMTVADSATGAAAYDGTDGLNGTEGKIHWGKTMAEVQGAYYQRPAATFGPFARNYCNKCHAKD